MLESLGVYGFSHIEPVILTALVTEDPLLIIGPSGTGKTYLLNSLSEALGLEHRHYNASMIGFDDLVGFPYPSDDKTTAHYLQTPATVWGAQSILVDEINRCRPEHQNRLFALIHDRKLQGVPLASLRYRWAAMNPSLTDQRSSAAAESYLGTEPLDPALADRFSLFIHAVDWKDLSDSDRFGVADPSGEGQLAQDGGGLALAVAHWRAAFETRLLRFPAKIVRYVVALATAMGGAGVRISPRRTRMIARSLLAMEIINGRATQKGFKSIVGASLAQVACGIPVPATTIQAAHSVAWQEVERTAHGWGHRFLNAKLLPEKLRILLDECPSRDEGTQALAELFADPKDPRLQGFAFVLFPAAVEGRLPIGPAGVEILGAAARNLYHCTGLYIKDESGERKLHLEKLRGGRQWRAGHMLTVIDAKEPIGLEEEVNACWEILAERRAS